MSLVGIGTGDAYGVPFETMPWFADELLAWDGRLVDAGGGFHGCKRGQYSDDTQMSLCLAKALIREGGFRVETVAAAYLDWYRSGEARGMGGSIRKALEAMDRGTPIDQCGQKGAKGNGTAMRALPLGLWYWRDLNRIAEVAELDARLTHDRDEAVDGSYAVAMLGAILANGQKPREGRAPIPARLVDGVRMGLPKGTALMGNALARAVEVSQKADKTAALAELAAELEGGVVETVGTALAVVLMATSYREAVELSIRAGGDTDTRAAIAGGLVSLYYPVPEEMSRQIDGVGELREFDALLLEPW